MTCFNEILSNLSSPQYTSKKILKRCASAPDLFSEAVERKVERCLSSCQITVSEERSSDLSCRLTSPLSIGDEDVFKPIEQEEIVVSSSPSMYQPATILCQSLPLPEYVTSDDEAKKRHDFRLIGKQEASKEVEKLKGRALGFISRVTGGKAKSDALSSKPRTSTSSLEQQAEHHEAMLQTHVMMQFKLDINRTVIYPDGKPNLRKTVTINGVPFGKESGKESKGDELSLLMMQVVKTHLLSVAREEYDPVNLQADVLLIFDKMHQGIQAFIMRKMLDVCGRVPDATLYAGFYDSTSYSLTINKDERSLTIVYKIEFIDFDGIAERQSKGAKLQDEESYENFIQRLPANQKALGLIEACLTLDPLKPEDARIKINFHPHNEEGKKLVHSLIPQGPGSVRKAAARFSSWVSEKFSPVKLRKEEPQSSS